MRCIDVQQPVQTEQTLQTLEQRLNFRAWIEPVHVLVQRISFSDYTDVTEVLVLLSVVERSAGVLLHDSPGVREL